LLHPLNTYLTKFTLDAISNAPAGLQGSVHTSEISITMITIYLALIFTAGTYLTYLSNQLCYNSRSQHLLSL
jgi:hypothetical protein